MQTRSTVVLAVSCMLVFVLIFILVYSGLTTSFDDALFRSLNDPASSSYVGAAAVILAQFGSEIVLGLVGVAHYFAARNDRAEVLLGIITVVALSDLLLAVLKGVYYRPRPYLVLQNVNLPFGPDSESSFPSGHATRAFAVMAFLSIRRGGRYSVLLLLAAIVAISRVVMGVHFPTDVTAGAFLGIFVAISGLLFLKSIIYPRLRPAQEGPLKSTGE